MTTTQCLSGDSIDLAVGTPVVHFLSESFENPQPIIFIDFESSTVLVTAKDQHYGVATFPANCWVATAEGLKKGKIERLQQMIEHYCHQISVCDAEIAALRDNP